MQIIINNLFHAIKVNPLKMKDGQKVLATAVAYHLIKHDKAMPVLVAASGNGNKRPGEYKFLQNKTKQNKSDQ